MKICTIACVVSKGEGVVGSFGPFNDLLKKYKFGGKRIKITYEIMSDYEERVALDMFGEAWTENDDDDDDDDDDVEKLKSENQRLEKK